MSVTINREVVHTGADNTVLPMNRWGPPNFSVNVKSGTWNIQGTTDQVNRGDTATWVTLAGASHPTGVVGTLAAAAAGFYSIDDVPLEAIKLTSVGAGTVRVIQSGLTDRSN